MPALTLFVKSLPDSASNERLTQIFSEVGPIKQCFVVNETGTKQCRGFGYVTFAMEEDARQAIKEVKNYDGKKIHVSVAKKKIHDKRKAAPKGQPPKEGEEKEGPLKEGPPEQEQQKGAPPKKGPPKQEQQNGAPPKKGPPKQEQQTGAPLKKGPPKQEQQTGAPLKKGPPKQAPQKGGPPKQGPQKGGPPKERPVKEGPPKEEPPKGEPQKEPPPKENEATIKGIRKSALKSKLIVRNLSFKCSEGDLQQTFAEFGTVLEAKIPLKPDGKMRGFGFVLFKNMSGAGKALKAMNMKEIKGRPVAVDWAIPKDKYLATQPASSQVPKKTEVLVKDEPDSDSEDEGGAGKRPALQKGARSKKAAQRAKQASSEDEEESDDDGEGIEENEVKEEEEDEEDGGPQESGDDDDDDDDKSSFDSEDDDDDDDDDDEDNGLDHKPRKPLPSDVGEGRTIFIRNLSFDTEAEGLEEALLRYGELNYIKIVLHPDTDHSKGCAFAQFKSKESAEKCIAAAQVEAENGGIRVDSRRLIVTAAVSRENAARLKDNKVKVESGARNLYLAREGLIRAGTKAADGVPEADMAKRTRFEEVKRTKLRDINVYVSKTRLCVHNLPKSVDNQKLKDVCLQAVKGSKGVRVTECRVMYDRKPEKGKVMGQSLGYGFVQFQRSDHALTTLRNLNNNPEIFGPNKRPIVEFSLEDGRKLKLKEQRQQKNKEQFSKPGKGGVKFQSQTGGGVKFQSQTGGGVKFQSPNATPGGANAKPGGANAKPGGANAKPGGANAKPGGANVKPGGANATPGGANATAGGANATAGGANATAGGANAQPGGLKKNPPSAQLKRNMGPQKVTHFSGFQSQPEVEYVELEDGKKKRKVLPFPSHRGPKIRLRDKGKQQAPPKKPKGRTSRKERQGPLMVQKPTQARLQSMKLAKRPFKNKEDDRFESMVEKYKNKIMGEGKKPASIKRNKWFS